MYVKIIKGSGWYINRVGEIFNVLRGSIDYSLLSNKGLHIRESDCEEINLDQFDGKISEDFAKAMLNNIVYYSSDTMKDDGTSHKREVTIKLTLDALKKEGYIKQSREDELRGEIKKLENNIKLRVDMGSNYRISLLEELIQILDNKNKEEK